MNKESMNELLENLKGLYELLKSEETYDITYVLNELPQLIVLLNNSLISEEVNYDRIVAEVRNKFNSFFPPHGRLSDYYIWRDDFQERKEINTFYDSYLNKIWSILNH